MYWWQLQQLLLNVLPPDILVLNHQLVDIVHDDQRGLAYAKFAPNRQRKNQFKNWRGDPDYDMSSEQTHQTPSLGRSSEYFMPLPEEGLVSCAAKIIIGADGINSVARRCIYRDTCPAWENYAEALYSGLSMVGSSVPEGVIPEQNGSLDYVDEARFVTLTCNPDVVAFDTMRIVVLHNLKTSKSTIGWGFVHHVPIEEHTVRNASDEELQRYVVDKIQRSGFSEDIVSLYKQVGASGESSNYRTPYSIVPAAHPPSYEAHPTASNVDYPDGFKRPWYYGRVVLAGDAAHGNAPMMGQGAAMGLEDVYVLMETLSSKGVFSIGENGGVPKDVLQEVFEEYYSHRIDRVCFLQKYVMNRISEYDVEKTEEVREKLWSYGPSSVKSQTVRC